MNWFDVILGGVIGLLTGYFGITVITKLLEIAENVIKSTLGIVGIRVGCIFELLIRLIILFPIGYILFYVPFFVALPLAGDRHFVYMGWYFGTLIGLIAYTLREEMREEKQKRGRIRFRIW
jgi:hypothetical protein